MDFYVNCSVREREITMKSRNIKKILFFLCAVVFVLGVTYLVWNYINQAQNQDVYAKLQKKVTTVVGNNMEIKKPDPIIPINFQALKETNPDIYAWIRIEDTNIDYPILQSPTDDAYYLNHTVEGKAGLPGSIYTEKVNEKDFSDFNTVIYGHDMKNGTMFKHLHKYEDEEFFETHDKVLIYTEKECKTYQVFAAVVYDNRHLMYSFDNENVEDRKAFLQSVYESNNMKNHIRKDIHVDENSHIITMSTCIGGSPDKRFLVMAVEINE